jgi:anaerobic ribonucleoside-triphosphate reductase activating protein
VTSSIRLSRVHFPVTVLGPGTRLGIWVQGCHLACPGCMSRDTWDADGGSSESITGLAGVWRKVRDQGATGLTVSGGEPAEQAGEVAELVHQIRQVDAELTHHGRPQDSRAGAQRRAPLDVLVFSGLDEEQFRAACPALAECADAAILGPFDITQPTDLVWRGSGNQRLVTFTALGTERYAQYLDAATASPAMQFVVDPDRIWTIGIPRIGDLPALERRLREHGVEAGGVSWRP